MIVDLGLDDLPAEPSRGLELITDLRRDEHNVAIMICSGFRDRITLEKGMNAGADDYLMKPLDMEEFIARLNGLLSR